MKSFKTFFVCIIIILIIAISLVPFLLGFLYEICCITFQSGRDKCCNLMDFIDETDFK
jgi:hypothetical protein